MAEQKNYFALFLKIQTGSTLLENENDIMTVICLRYGRVHKLTRQQKKPDTW
jgi:hypothetical protein